jgi:hypothetical protein
MKSSFFLLALFLAPTVRADVHVLTATLDGAQETPPVATTASGSAVITVDNVTGYVHVIGTFDNLTTPISAVHLHGLAAPGVPAGVLFGLTSTGSTSGTYEGSATLTPAQITGVLDGLSYVNVHSGMHAGGEIRGQAIFDPVVMVGGLDGPQAGTPSTGTGTYSVTVDRNTNQITISGTYTGLTTTVTVAHLHGPAWFGIPAGVLIGVVTTGGTAGTYNGSMTVSDTVLDHILDGFTYVNVHTTMFPAGEIRGQVILPTLGTQYCAAAPNSTGNPGVLVAVGSPRVVDNMLQLDASDLPLNSFGYIIASQSSGQTFPAGNSSGRICIAGPNLARLGSTIQNSGLTGTFSASINLTSIPTNPPSSVAAGDTWNFQAWHRDTTFVGVTSNFTNAVSISFR